MGRNLSLRIGKRKKNGVPYFSVWVPERLSVSGVAKERLFRRRSDAEVYRLELLEAWRRVDEVPLDSGELADARAALLVLKEAGLLGVVSLEEAVRAGLPAVRREAQMTVSALLAEFRRVRSKGWRERTEKNFRYAEGRFCAVFGERTLGSLRAEELSEWLDNIGGEGGSRANLRRTLEPAFNYAVRQEVLKVSPWEKVETERREIVGAVDVLTVPEALRLMEVAPEDCKAAYALLLFAGIRPKELERLTWGMVKEGFVHVGATVAKTRQIRNVEVLPNLAAWLEVYRRADSELIVPPNWKRKNQDTRRAAGIEHRQDVTRHSFASYHLALFGDANRTGLQMGHSARSGVLFAHYRAAVTATAAAGYFGIIPPGKSVSPEKQSSPNSELSEGSTRLA